ncbi:MAG TPA: hypothetical protein DHI91_01640 [Candidatus Portnoybacteria bacterium]|uniref:Uncharacterized protein n=1 Tax=Candidatus Portnoybacteria bacterium CG02_land_8_20_14_3_00_45_8 TaxID=1974807 RepID=A0A2M7D6X8_9BACT|nr:MAG: hypothetical protein COS30_00315 [Candidatus Portnoybacteria bacterium CG02_land_8_20_14_3_00_45_8]HCX27822.1 hypothetical protein [Candidatus Portnoybacteria bacterium]
MEANTTNPNITDAPDRPEPPDDWQIKFSRLPDYVQEWFCSTEVAQNNAAVCQKFGLPKDRNPFLADLTGQVIFKEFLLEKLPEIIASTLETNSVQAQKIAAEVALKQLLPIREYLVGVEKLIPQWGGVLPIVLPPKPQARASTSVEPVIKPFAQTAAQPASQAGRGSQGESVAGGPAPAIFSKPFREAAQENKEILNQLLTAAPIKIADFDQPVRPTIKNWLADYIKQKGAKRHDELERGDYLFNSANIKGLLTGERIKLAEILKAYDENSAMPILSDTGLIALERLGSAVSPARPTSSPTTPPSARLASPSASQAKALRAGQPARDDQGEGVAGRPAPVAPPAQPKAATASDLYRESVTKSDLTGIQKPLPRPAPRLDGNIVDLSNQ